MSSLLKYFDTTYLINLPERRDRLVSCEREFDGIGWHIGDGGVQLFSARKFVDRSGFPNASVRGAFYSHWNCLQRALQMGLSSVMILEDDISFSPSVRILANSIISWLDKNDWDFVFFGHHQTGKIPLAYSRTTSEEFKFQLWTSNIQGLHFYAVNGRILARLNDHLERVACEEEGDQKFGPMPVDGAFNNFRGMNYDVRTFIAIPKLGWQRPSRSDITPRMFDRYRILRPLTTVMRNLKHRAIAWRS